MAGAELPETGRTVRIALCLISHTNAGKTTLARTLLGRDVGEVRDEAHTTIESESHLLLSTPEGDELRLWDTPGFGDSVRLCTRVRLAGNPIGWFLTEVWDRWSDRAFYLAQKAVRTAARESDVVLYLVNASENPEDAGYVAPEMEILALLGKPVIVLLNQTGRAPDDMAEVAEVEKWRTHLRGFAKISDVLTLDAFASCWIHEGRLIEAVGRCLADEDRAGYARLARTWSRRNEERFDASMRQIARELLNAASQVVEVQSGPLLAGGLPGLKRKPSAAELRARERLLAVVAAAREETTRKLLVLHGLEGDAGRYPYLQWLDSTSFDSRAPIDSVKAGIVGGIVSGAAGGLASDLMAGGLTLGAGTLVGAIAGALSAGGLAAGANRIRGVGRHLLRLDDEAMQILVEEEFVKYVAISHFARGRGEFVDEEAPAFWKNVTREVVRVRAGEMIALWTSARTQGVDDGSIDRMSRLISEAMLDVLRRLHPDRSAARPR